MARHFKSNSWAPRVSGSSGAVHLGRTDEASPKTSLVPVPVLVVGFKSTGIALTGVNNPVRPPEVVEHAPPPPAEESTAGGEAPARSEPPAAAPDDSGQPAPAKERRAQSSSGQGDSIDLIIDKAAASCARQANSGYHIAVRRPGFHRFYTRSRHNRDRQFPKRRASAA